MASGLTVRVINNITKKLDVKQRFLETFKNDGFPTQFQYKQKVGHCSFANGHSSWTMLPASLPQACMHGARFAIDLSESIKLLLLSTASTPSLFQMSQC